MLLLMTVSGCQCQPTFLPGVIMYDLHQNEVPHILKWIPCASVCTMGCFDARRIPEAPP
jgi:hypothetical protein